MTQKWLLPIDGSDTSLEAARWAVANVKTLREAPEIHLVNVQSVLPNDIGRFINAETIKEFHLENGMKALATARDVLAAAGLAPTLHVLIGDPASGITDFAASHGCSQIVIGTRGHSGLTGTLLGSVAMKVVHHAKVPVLLVR
jgi:nucleotide-binding universal stress UspA family protein